MKKTDLITGASSGIGKATTRLFAGNARETELTGPGAVTDGADPFRYLAGDDSRGFIRVRREVPDQDCMDFVRSRFPSPEVAQ